MRKVILLSVGLSAFSALSFPSVEGLVKRILPNHWEQIVLKDLAGEKQGKGEQFAYWSDEEGRLVLEGNSPIAQASALGWYLRHTAKVAPFWEGFEADRLPKKLPTVKTRIEQRTPYRHRVYFNFCTLSYSAAFWDWKRWEYEIDLMALQGFNMPLQPIGLEGVWYRMLQHPEIGFTEAEARAFLVGPAYTAWQWMTNIEGFGGPMPKACIDARVELGRKIFERELSFGMRPIQQGFTGYVPHLMAKKFPQAKIKQQPPWSGSFKGSSQLDPLDPLFPKLARIFYAEQKNLFGLHGLYATDPFHESAPPQKGNDYLASVGRAIFKAAVEADPDATLCIQSWSIRMPIVRVIPKNHVLILDIGGKWNRTKSFDGYPFVVGDIHSFGGRSRMFGNIEGLTRNSFLNTLKRNRNCVGIGSFPEAVQLDPVYFAALFDLIWRDAPVSYAQWIKDFVDARYGSGIPEAHQAWHLLRWSVYRGCWGGASLIAARPALDVRRCDPNGTFCIGYPQERPLKAWELLVSIDSKTSGGAYQFDVANTGRQVMSDVFFALHADVINAFVDRDIKRLKAASSTFCDFALDMDRLCGTVPLLSFEKWVQDARALPGSAADKDLYDFNASCLFTRWGYDWNFPRIADYAWKEWSGLIRGYHLTRWRYFHASLVKTLEEGREWHRENTIRTPGWGQPAFRENPFYNKLADLEDLWINTPHTGYKPFKPGDAVSVSREIFARWGGLMREKLASNPVAVYNAARRRIVVSKRVPIKSAGTPVFEWSPKVCFPEKWNEWTVDISKFFTGAGRYQVTFCYTKGGARIEVAGVSLLQNGEVISKDFHNGISGAYDRDNRYIIEQDEDIIGATYTLRVRARSNGPNPSYGKVMIRKL